jgi:hypothetical protein
MPSIDGQGDVIAKSDTLSLTTHASKHSYSLSNLEDFEILARTRNGYQRRTWQDCNSHTLLYGALLSRFLTLPRVPESYQLSRLQRHSGRVARRMDPEQGP